MTEKSETFAPTLLADFSDRHSAPITFFDGAGPYGFYNGIVHVTLGAAKHLPAGSGCLDVRAEPVAVAFLRCNVQGAINLRDAIDKALLMAAPAQGPAN